MCSLFYHRGYDWSDSSDRSPRLNQLFKVVQTSLLSASSHPLINALSHCSDQDLLTLFQRHPERGQYFVMIFCRYSPIVHTLIKHSVRSPVQADYLFAITWRHVFNELGGLNLREGLSADVALTTLQNWLINMTATCINRVKLPPVESIQYSLQSTSPPLGCYVERSLDQLEPTQRLIILMAQTFHWSETRISAYLQAEGEYLSPTEVKQALAVAYQQLERVLPGDISEIYLGQLPDRSEGIAEIDRDEQDEDLFDLAAFGLEQRSR
jgi:hypothetical protein